MLEFETFKDEAEQRGYVAYSYLHINNQMWVKTRNGVTLEVKNVKHHGGDHIIVCKRSQEELELLEETILEAGYMIVNRTTAAIRVAFASYHQYYDIVDMIEHIDEIVAAHRGLVRKLFPQKTFNPELIAARYFYAIQAQDQDMLDMGRHMLSADRYDREITINTPSERRSYREHIVPCIMLHNEIIDRIMIGIRQAEIAQLIRDNLKIAYIDPADAARLDGELGLKTSMPAGWTWGDAP